MPRKTWTTKDERQYKAVLKSCLKKDGRKTKACKSLAARVVNKRRSQEGRTKTSGNQTLTWFQKALIQSLGKRPPFNPEKLRLRAASKKECLVKSGPRKGRAKAGCFWGWGKYSGKLFTKRS